MGRGFKHGVSLYDLLNFSIIPYKTEAELLAAAPGENTIGLVTHRPVTNWAFSPDAPVFEGSSMTWVVTGAASDYAFNGLKEQMLQLCPLEVVQYALSKWNYVHAFLRKNGEWVFLWHGQLYMEGTDVQRVTGGWQTIADAGSTAMNAVAPTLTQYSTYMLAKLSGYNQRGYVSTVNAVDVTDYQQLELKLNSFTKKGNGSAVTLELVDAEGNIVRAVPVESSGSHSMDVSDLTGSYQLRLMMVASTYGAVTLYVARIAMY